MDIAKAISEYGVLTVITALFLINTINDKKTLARAIDNIAKAIDNIAKTLDLLKQSNDNSTEIFTKHDERSIKIDEKLTKIEAMTQNCGKRR